MSRTRRTLPRYHSNLTRRNYGKWYSCYSWEWPDHIALRDFDQATCDDWLLREAHAWVFRNGSCRRQRKNGVLISKNIDRRQQRALFKEALYRDCLDAIVDELTLAMITSRSNIVGTYRGGGHLIRRNRTRYLTLDDIVVVSHDEYEDIQWYEV